MEDQEYTCELCNVPYATELELQDHKWSLMHHIKIEKIKKGAPHSCELCMTLCANVIEYGKHLNEDRHKLALSRRQKDGPDEPLNSFANIPDTTADMDTRGLDSDFERRPQSFSNNNKQHLDKHGRSFSQPELHHNSEGGGRGRGMYHGNHGNHGNQGNWQHPQHHQNQRPQQGYSQDGWQGWEDMIPGFSQSLGAINDSYMRGLGGGRGRDPMFLSQPHRRDTGQYFRDDFDEMNWNDGSFYNPWQQQEQDAFMNMHANRGRKGSLDSSFRKPDSYFSKKKKGKGPINKSRGRSWDRGQEYDSNVDYQHWGYDEGMQELQGGSDGRGGVPERGRGILRGGRGQSGQYEQTRSDKYSPESNSSTDSGGLKRRLEDESFKSGGKSRRGNESNRITPDSQHKIPLLDLPFSTERGRTASTLLKKNDQINSQRARSHSHDRLYSEGSTRMETDQLSRSTGGPSSRKVTWSDQQLVVSSTTEPEIASTKHLASSLDRQNKLKKVKPDSSSERKKTSGKHGKKNSNNRRNYSPEGDSPRSRKARSQFKNVPKENTSTDSVLEKAEKLCKKLRNDREKAKQQKSFAEKQKKMSKTDELNVQIEELSRKNQQHIKGHLDTVENALLSKSVSADSTVSSNMSASQDKIHEKPEKLYKSMPGRASNSSQSSAKKDLPTKESSQSKDADISERIARTRADIDAIRAKIEGSVQAETGGQKVADRLAVCSPPLGPLSRPDKVEVAPSKPASKEADRRPDKVEVLPSKPARAPPPADMLSPGQHYSPSSSTHKPDHNALLKMVKSPRSTKERIWLAEMLRTHVNSQTKLSLPRFNLKFSDLCTGSERPNDLTDFDISNLAPSVQLEIADIIEADTKPDIIQLQKLLDNASAENAELDSNILSELGLLQTPTKEDHRPRSVSPMRTGSPIVSASSKYVDYRPSLSIEDLSTVEDFTSAPKSQGKERTPDLCSPPPTSMPCKTGFSSAFPTSDIRNTERNTPSPQTVMSKPSQYDTGIKIKEEKMDEGYGMASSMTMPPPNSRMFHSQYETSSREPQDLEPSPSPRLYPSQYEVSSREQRSQETMAGSRPYPSQNEAFSREPKDAESSVGSWPYSGQTEATSREPMGRELPGRPLSPVRKSIHTQNLYSGNVDVPERDRYQSRSKSPEADARSALQKVTDILDAAPTADKVLSGGQSTSSPVPTAKDAGFNSSQTSQTSSVLDQVYNISLQEENVRHEINTTDLKIKQLQRLIDEASEQLKRFSTKRKELIEQEDTFRSSRMKLLQESRSQHGSSSSQAEGTPTLLGNLTDAQMQNLNNPVFLKFLMSQRQSDLSSVGGYSNVETGSQSEQEPYTQRRASITSNCDPQPNSFTQNTAATSDPQPQLFTQNIGKISDPQLPSSRQNTVVTTSESITQSNQLFGDKLFSQSIDALSGSTETLSSSYSKSKVVRDSGMPVPDSSVSGANSDRSEVGVDKEGEASKSISLLNTPLEKVGFITLDALLKGDSDIGKLLHKSLESFNKDNNPAGQDASVQKQESSENLHQAQPQSTSQPTAQCVAKFDRERRDSSLSIGSDDILMSGSDVEKRSGKVSMKYMGTLPDGISYNTLAKQMSGGSGNKTVMFTVLNSPEAMSQLKRTSDGEVSPQIFPSAKPELKATSVAFNSGLTNVKRETRSDLTDSTNTITADLNDMDTHSVKSNYSLGEQIKRMCEGQNPDSGDGVIFTPRSEESSGEKTLEDETGKANGRSKTSKDGSPIQDCYVQLDRIDPTDYANLLMKSKLELQQRSSYQDAGSPVRKRLKSKKERDQMSRRKQKESFILNSDTNSEADVDQGSHSSRGSKNHLNRSNVSKSEDDLVQSGSEEKTPRVPNHQETAMMTGEVGRVEGGQTPGDVGRTLGKVEDDGKVSERSEVKRSLLDEVQLETETPSDSCEDRSLKPDGTSFTADERLVMSPNRLATFRANIKAKLGPAGESQSTPTSTPPPQIPTIEYRGPQLSVAAVQEFQGDLYVCYNGSEVRRFNLKTGEILKELDCSPYLVNTLHVIHVEERHDVLYLGGACKKLMLFEPKKFNLLGTFDYEDRIACLHERWGRLFIGLSDGSVSVRSLKTDKELTSFSCTTSPVSCMASASAGMTKMLCLGTADKIIYVADAITGLLITMLEGHTLPPLCIQVFGETVLSGAADQTLLVHNVSTGELIKTVKSTKPITSLWTDDAYIYISCCDNLVRCYDSNFRLEKVCYGAGKGIVSAGLVHDGMLITGNREGLVEAAPLALLNGRWECKFGSCSLEFTCRDHLRYHVLSDHNSSRASQCTHRGCQFSFPDPESRQEHILSHLK